MSRSKLLQRLAAAGSDLPAFVAELIHTQAVWVAGTEAVAFGVQPVVDEKGQQGFNLSLIKHIRPDNSPPEVRQQALQAFAEIVQPCVAKGHDGVIQVTPGDGAVEPQFCLVTPLRS